MTALANKDVQNPALEVGVFDTVDAAREAVRGLLEVGFSQQQITVVCSDDTKERYFSRRRPLPAEPLARCWAD
jgi:copper oxidase (laccase) domain-containing protein